MDRTDTYDRWIGIDVVDRNGDRLGEIADIYYDDVSQRPEWVSIKAGLFKGHRIAPIAGARIEQVEGDDADDDGRLILSVDKDTVDAAPHDFGDDGHLTPMMEQELYRHFGFDWNRRDTADYGYGDLWEQNRFDKDYPRQQPPSTQDRDVTTRSEEELRVSKQREQAGTARLRKYVVTENVNVKVPVQKEQVRIEREPITDANRADAMSRPDIADVDQPKRSTK